MNGIQRRFRESLPSRRRRVRERKRETERKRKRKRRQEMRKCAEERGRSNAYIYSGRLERMSLVDEGRFSR